MATQNILFSSLTTLRIGGPIKHLVAATTYEIIVQTIEKAKVDNLPWIVIGGGSNLLVSDSGFDGYVIQNFIQGIEKNGDVLEVGSGCDLQYLVGWIREHELSGFEKLIGIPGTIGGAVYGNAGAYGQVISNHIIWVDVITQDAQVKRLTKDECEFRYRDSKFKRTKETIVKVGFTGMLKGEKEELKKISSEIITTRLQKYPAGIACPGSFFKNVEVNKLHAEVVKNIPEDKVIYGKIPAGWLLEAVGAKGQRVGNVEVASWHGNLLMNTGGGRARDFIQLAGELKKKVNDKFGIIIEPEVQLVGFEEPVLRASTKLSRMSEAEGEAL